MLGLGTYGLRGEDGIASLVAGIETGYRLLDTAVNYENEAEVGDAIRRSGIDRDELIVTTKIPGRSHGFEEALASTNESLIVLGLDRIDVSLIHWPNPRVDKYVDTWRAMIELRERGLAALDRGVELHRGDAHAPDRRDGRRARGQPGRAAPLLPADGAARLPRASTASAPRAGARSRSAANC